ncbi:MAG: DUF4340 domain-containing protein [Phycisphaerae bacterium]|nr:DUF4340 domain-containing protein [Phycisphaerae bacterium]
MSSRTVVVALVAAILLAAAAMLVISLPKGGGAAPSVPVGDRVLDADVGAVVRVELTSGGRTDVIRAGRTPGTWDLVPAGLSDDRAWALDAGRVRELLRVIGELRCSAAPSGEAKIEAGGSALKLSYGDGSTAEIRLSPRVLAGQGLLAVRGRTAPGVSQPVERLALVPDQLHALLSGQGARAWRERLVLAGATASAARVRLINRTGSVALSRVAGRWAVTEPVGAPADPQAVARLLATLEGIQAARFYDEALPDTSTGLDQPAARLIVELEWRDAQGRPVAVSRDLSIGGPADAGGRNLFAAVDEGGGQRTLLAVDAAALSKISLDPGVYVTRPATALSALDIGAVTVATTGGSSPTVQRGWRRSPDGWVEVLADGRTMLLQSQQAAEINGLVAYLTAQAPSAVRLDAVPNVEPLATIRLANAQGEPLEEIEVLAVTEPSAAPLVLRSGRVSRLYGAPPALLETMLGERLPKARAGPSPAGSGGAGPAKDINK